MSRGGYRRGRSALAGPLPSDPPDVALVYRVCQRLNLPGYRLAEDVLGRNRRDFYRWLKAGQLPLGPKRLLEALDASQTASGRRTGIGASGR